MQLDLLSFAEYRPNARSARIRKRSTVAKGESFLSPPFVERLTIVAGCRHWSLQPESARREPPTLVGSDRALHRSSRARHLRLSTRLHRIRLDRKGRPPLRGTNQLGEELAFARRSVSRTAEAFCRRNETCLSARLRRRRSLETRVGSPLSQLWTGRDLHGVSQGRGVGCCVR